MTRTFFLAAAWLFLIAPAHPALTSNAINSESSAELLRTVRNTKESGAVRTEATVALFRKYSIGKTIFELKTTWKISEWLQPSDVWAQNVLAGASPLTSSPGKTVVVIAPHFGSADRSLIFLKLSTSVDTSTFQAMLLKSEPSSKRAVVEDFASSNDKQH